MADDNTHLPIGHLLHGKRIAIIGAGPAGLTLARLLQKQDVSVSVFERDHQANARLQGGSLDLHPASGQRALEQCGLIEQFHALARPEGDVTTIVDKRGAVLASETDDEDERAGPEIDRGALRDLLLHSLAAETISWGRALAEIRHEEGRSELRFDDGHTASFDIVIGADGARSKVRPLITPIAAFYTGVTFVEARLSDVDDRHPDIARYVGSGHVLALGDDKGLLAQRNGDGSIRVYIARRCPEGWLTESGIDLQNAPRAREQLISWFPDWAPELVEMVRQSDDRFLPWPLYAFPADQTLSGPTGVTVIGDAAHVMPPFLGIGANMAMLDAVELANNLISAEFPDLAAAIETFQRSMLARTAPLLNEVLATQDLLFAEDAPTALVQVVCSNMPSDRNEPARSSYQ